MKKEIKDGIIEMDSELGKELGFTSEKKEIKEKIPKNIEKALKKVCPREKGQVFGIKVYEYGGVPNGEIWIFTPRQWYKLTI